MTYLLNLKHATLHMTMKKNIIALIFLTLCPTLQAQQPAMRDVFKQMPDSLCPLLTAVNKADFVDFMDSHMKAEVTNTLKGKSEMKELTGSYTLIQLTEQHTLQLKLLPVGTSKWIVCVIHTAFGPAPDSRINFYDTQWNALPTHKYLPALPTMEQFVRPYTPNDTMSPAQHTDLVRKADVFMLEMKMGEADNNLHFNLGTTKYLDAESLAKLRPLLISQVTYVWRKKFARQ